MKHAFIVTLLTLIAYSPTYAADYLRLDYDGGYESTTANLDFMVLRECPTPEKIYGGLNGWVVTATGDATWTLNAGIPNDPLTNVWWNLGGLYQTYYFDNVSPDTFLLGGAGIPPGGMPVFSDEKRYFTLKFTWGEIPDGGEGQVCFDSSFVLPITEWMWSGLACGLGGAPNRPLFLCGAAGADVHPCCFEIEQLVCTDPTINVTPMSDEIAEEICGTATFDFDADPGLFNTEPATIVDWNVISGIGTIDNAGHYSASVGPDECGTYDVCIEVINDCRGSCDEYCFQVTFVNHDPYFVDCPNNCAGSAGSEDWYPLVQDNDTTVTLNVGDPDPCQGTALSIGNITYAGDLPFLGTVALIGNDLTIETTDTDGGILVCVTVVVTDEQGATAECDVGFNILTTPFEVQIDKLHDVYQGHYAYVGINMNKGSDFIGGFDFLVSYDASALTFMGAELGWWLNGCYEYFTYRYNWNGNCGGPCPTGLLRVVGIADINNGPNHPDLYCLRRPGPEGEPYEMVKLTFYVTNDRTFECMCVPIRFFWHDCGDNALSNIMGDTLFISDHVYNFEGNEVTGDIHYGGHW